ncbi:MAG: hypothetical protein IJB50_03225 [Clostridia bacterium]|nr:hypothetical protein [Clostridia bacterium]
MQLGDLRLYNRDFKLLSILPKYLSANWEIKFKEFGLGEIEFEKTDEIVSLLTENKYLFLFQGDIQAIITGYKIGETVTVFLRTLEWLLTKYTVEKFEVKDLMNVASGTTFTISMLLEYILSTYLHPDFNVEFSGIKEDVSDVSDFVSENLETVYSVVRKILSDDKYGFRFFLDTDQKRFVFLLLLAKENENILLCDEYKTAYESEYSFDLQEEISGGVFYQSVKNMGKWDAENNEPQLSITPDNYGKYYTVSADGTRMGLSVVKGDIVLCKDKSGQFSIVDEAEPFLVKIAPEENGIFSFSGILNTRDFAGADEEIKATKALDMLTSKTRLVYKDDFNLGDIVKVKYFAGEMSCEKKKLVKEIHLWDEPDDTGAMPTTIDI